MNQCVSTNVIFRNASRVRINHKWLYRSTYGGLSIKGPDGDVKARRETVFPPRLLHRVKLDEVTKSQYRREDVHSKEKYVSGIIGYQDVNIGAD